MSIASVHFLDVGPGSALRLAGIGPRLGEVPGMLSSQVSAAIPLNGSSRPASPLRRVSFVAFWEDDDALTRFLDASAFGRRLAQGWHARLEPLRAYGTWPGLPADTPAARVVPGEGPALVLTLGFTRLSQFPRFVRTAAKAEAAAMRAPGAIWATAMARPMFVGTCSLWESAQAAIDYAYGQADSAHLDAIAEDRSKPFHKTASFIRFRPYDVQGELRGKNPLPAGALA